jgi:hypothetical protein
MIAAGFTDNGGAIHSAERILNTLGQRLKYPNLAHMNNYKNYEHAEFSVEARRAYENGEPVYIEHVSPIRDFTRKAIEIVTNGTIEAAEVEAALEKYIRQHYRLVLLTAAEAKKLNRINRSRMEAMRLENAGIVVESLTPSTQE